MADDDAPLTISREKLYQNDLERMKKAFGRLLGADWPDTFKISEDYKRGSTESPYYGEKSVFAAQKESSDD